MVVAGTGEEETYYKPVVVVAVVSFVPCANVSALADWLAG